MRINRIKLLTAFLPLYALNIAASEAIPIKNSGNWKFRSDDAPVSVAFGDRNEIIVSTYTGIYKLNQSNNNLKKIYSNNSDLLSSLCILQDTIFLVGTPRDGFSPWKILTVSKDRGNDQILKLSEKLPSSTWCGDMEFGINWGEGEEKTVISQANSKKITIKDGLLGSFECVTTWANSDQKNDICHKESDERGVWLFYNNKSELLLSTVEIGETGIDKFPFSKNGKYFLAEFPVYDDKSVRSYVALIDIKLGTIVGRINAKKTASIYDFALNSDGTSIAILIENETLSKDGTKSDVAYWLMTFQRSSHLNP